MDLTSLDMVVGGSIKMSDDTNEKLFLYLVQESTCTVPWNFFEDRKGEYYEWDGLGTVASRNNFHSVWPAFESTDGT